MAVPRIASHVGSVDPLPSWDLDENFIPERNGGVYWSERTEGTCSWWCQFFQHFTPIWGEYLQTHLIFASALR